MNGNRLLGLRRQSSGCNSRWYLGSEGPQVPLTGLFSTKSV